MTELKLQVTGMTCTTCEKTIERGLLAKSGVQSVTVSSLLAKCSVTYDAEKIGPRQLIEGIEDLGFNAVL